MNRIFSRAATAFAFSAAIAIAGPNKDAELFIDCVPTTAGIDSMGACIAESSFTAGIFIRNANKVFSYQYSIAFDTSRLRFVKAIKGNDDVPNFLESKGQSLSFKGNREIADSTRILIAGWLSGDDTSQCTGGAGCLALVTFKKRGGDTTALSLAKIIILDCGLSEDTACVVHGAKVAPGIMGASRRACPGAIRGRDRVEFANGKVRISAQSGGGLCRAFISDVSGREILRFSQRSTTMEADLKSASRGMYFVSIVRETGISTYPFLVGR